MQDSIFIKLDHLTKTYAMAKSEFVALYNISLLFSRGEFTGLVGPSGSGKTTLLNIIGSLDTPTRGNATVLDQPVRDLNQKQSAALRNEYMGFIFQTYNLLPVYSVYENVKLPLLLLKKHTSGEMDKMIRQALDWVGILDKIKLKPAQLSGGEAQRVAVARAMVKQPLIVLADEPTANLDYRNSHNILKTMKQLNQELGTTFIFATHDEKVIQYLNRKITLEDGRVARDE
ncbi:MAG: ABC transporter ATP-binding protein [candidate division KSB1 bacterium]|nr:ABC transporter ATP-binding protein [candidate division KSB1 bacterium]